MLRVALLNGCKHNYDHDITKLISPLINGNCVVSWLEVTAGTVSAWYWFLEAVRKATGDSAYILVSLTEDDTGIDTSWTTKIWIEFDQTKIDDSTLINENQDNVASLQTGSDYPSTPHIKLASTASWTITDEREFISLKQGVNKSLTETITWLKLFSLFPQKSWDLTPSNDADFATKKYIDTSVTQANAINRFEALRVLGEDLNAWDTYMIGLWGASVDKTGGSIFDMIIWSSAWDLIKYAWIVTDPASNILRRIREFEIVEQWSPTSDLTVYWVDEEGNETQIATTTDSSLTIGSAFTLDTDLVCSKLKFVASASNGTNYYKAKIVTDTMEEIEAGQINHNLETLDSSSWTAFQTLTIDLLSNVTDIEFAFQSSSSGYFAEMDWRIKHNGTVVIWPNNSSGSWTGWVTQSATWLSLSVSPGDTLTLEMMTPNNRSSSYYYRAKDFKATWDGTTIKWFHDWGYIAWAKYLARGNNLYRNKFDGIELQGDVEWATTEWAEWWHTAISPSLLWAVFLDDTWWLTLTKKDIYIGEWKGAQIEIIKQRPQTYNEFMEDQGFSLQAGDKEVSIKDTGNIYTTEITYDLWVIAYEVIAPETGTFRFACDLRSGNSSSSVYAYMGLYINDVYITETNTNLDDYTLKYIDYFVQKGDNIKYRLRTSHVSYSASMDNMVVKSWGYLPDTSYFTVV